MLPSILLLLCITAAQAVPFIRRVPVDDNEWKPTFLSPEPEESYEAGETMLVAWDTSDLPRSLYGAYGMLGLRILPYDAHDASNLDIPLAFDVPFCMGYAKIQLHAALEPRDDYVITFIGDSTATSARFSVTRPCDEEMEDEEMWAEEEVKVYEGQQVFLIKDSPGGASEEGLFSS